MREKIEKIFERIVDLFLLILVLLVIFVVLSFFLPENGRSEERKYLHIGRDPYGFKQITGEEKVFILQSDKWVETRGGSGRVYRGWVAAGTEVVAVPTKDAACPPNSTCYVAVRIYRCGNPLVGSTGPNGSQRILFAQAQPQIETVSISPTQQPVAPERITVAPPEIPPVSAVPTPVPAVAPRRCDPSVPVITGALGSLAGLLARNPWTGAVLGAAGGLLGYLGGSSIVGCPPNSWQAAEAAVVGGVGGALWGRRIVHKHYHISPSAPNPPVVNTLPARVR